MNCRLKNGVMLEKVILAFCEATFILLLKNFGRKEKRQMNQKNSVLSLWMIR